MDQIHFPCKELDDAYSAKAEGKLVQKTLQKKYGKPVAELLHDTVLASVMGQLEHEVTTADEHGNTVRRVERKPRPSNVQRLTVDVEPPQQAFKVGAAIWTQEIRV